MHLKKHLSFSGLIKLLSDRFSRIEDSRRAASVTHRIHDVFMSGFAMMYFQDPSVLSFQHKLMNSTNRCNLQTMFAMQSIPKDSQMRDVLDDAPTDELEGVFNDYLNALQRGNHLSLYRFLEDYYLLTLDGSEYFASTKICCPGCLKQTTSSGEIRYHHQILQAVLVHPDMKQVLPLAPEAVKNQDGNKKQDCEINAAKRLLPKIRQSHPRLKLIVTGDGLYSKQPFIKELKKADMSYILVAKPTDHDVLFDWVKGLDETGDLERLEALDAKGKRYVYEWANAVPLNGQERTETVNFFQFRIVTKDKVTYKNSWITDIPISKSNIKDLVRGGRARWKIENETFNTLKNQGYNIEHNYGHGSNNLSMSFFLLNLLAFYTHQILELSDVLYQRCRAEFTSRVEFWNQLRCTFRFMVFETWECMLEKIIAPPELAPP